MRADSKKRRSWKRIVAAQIAVCAAGVLLAEVGFRAYLRFSGKPYDSAVTRDAIQLLRSRASDLTPQVRSPIASHPFDDQRQKPILHPYLGYIAQSKPGQWEVEMSRVGVPEYDDDYEILVVGGSVADIFGHAGVARMVEHLSADPLFANRRIYVYNYGLGGFKQPQMTNLVQFMLILGFTPECVIDIDGFNEVALTRENAFLGTNPLFPSSMHWGSLTVGAAPDREAMLLAAHGIDLQSSVVSSADRALRWGFPHSAIIGTIALNRMRSLTTQALEDFKAYSQRITTRSANLVRHGLPFPEDPTAIVAMGVKAWEEGSRTLRGLCAVRRMHYLHVLQPTLHDEGSKPLTKREIENGIAPPAWIEGVHIGYPLLREAGQRLKAEGEDFVDATQIFANSEQNLYFDNCHFGDEGNWMLGEFVARSLLESLRAAK